MNVDIPEVQSHTLVPRFYRENNIDYVEISAIGSKDTVKKKVTPALMAQFPAYWTAHCEGLPPLPRKGTALTELMSEQFAKKYFDANVQTLEEIAFLSDSQCDALGQGTVTLRNNAKQHLAKAEAARRSNVQDQIMKASAAPMPVASEGMAEVTMAIGTLNSKMDELIHILIAQNTNNTPKPRGRPRKEDNGTSDTASDRH